MQLNLNKKRWTDGLALERFDARDAKNAGAVAELRDLAGKYDTAVCEEATLSADKLAIVNVGRQDAKKHLEEGVSALMADNIVQTLGSMLAAVVF